MASHLMILLLLPLGVAAAAIVVVRRMHPLRRMTLTLAPNEHPAVVSMARHTRLCRLLGAFAGALAAVALASAGDAWLGRAMLLSPMTLGAGTLIGVIVGEWTARPVRGSARTASLRRRTLADLLPRSSRAQVVVGGLSAVAVLSIGTTMGSADDLGRPGRALARACTVLMEGELVELSGARGPWPGSYYTIPAALALTLVVLLAATATRSIVARQRPSAEDAALDDQLRRWSVMSVASATDATLRLTAAPLALAMTIILSSNLRLDECVVPGARPLMWVLGGLGVFWLATGLASLIEVFAGARIIVDEPSGRTPPAAAGVPVP